MKLYDFSHHNLIIGYFLTYCQVFLSNFRYSLGFVSGYCESGILPQFFATEKQLLQGYLGSLVICVVDFYQKNQPVIRIFKLPEFKKFTQ